MRKILVIVGFVMVTAQAATYLPISMEQQLKESHGVVHGYYSHQSFKKDHNGNIVTEHAFRVKQSAGMKNSQLINHNDFKVMVPGGVWQGVVYNVSGAPHFKAGEEVILLVTKRAGGHSLTNLALGKYEVYQEFGKTYIRSVVFPGHRRLGKMTLVEFEGLVKTTLGVSFEKVYEDTYVHKKSKNLVEGRKPASFEGPVEEKGINPFWFVICLALLGVYATVLFRDYLKDD